MKVDILVGSMMIVSALVGLIYVRRCPEKLVLLSKKQAMWCGVVALFCGALIIVLSFLEKH